VPQPKSRRENFRLKIPTFGGNHFNEFTENQLTKFRAVLTVKAKQTFASRRRRGGGYCPVPSSGNTPLHIGTPVSVVTHATLRRLIDLSISITDNHLYRLYTIE